MTNCNAYSYSYHGKSRIYTGWLSSFTEILLKFTILYSIVPSERVGSWSTSPTSWSSSVSSGISGCVTLISGEPSTSLPRLGLSTWGEGVSPSPKRNYSPVLVPNWSQTIKATHWLGLGPNSHSLRPNYPFFWNSYILQDAKMTLIKAHLVSAFTWQQFQTDK